MKNHLPVFCLAFVASVACADESLIGIWSYEKSYGEMLRGTLTVNKEGERWFATIGGQSAEFKPSADAIRFEFPNGAGRFRGRIMKERIEGFWIRPAVIQDPRYPEGSSQAYASPLDLVPGSQGIWQATVNPLPDPFTLYLRIFKGEDSALMAAFRNPEQNSRGAASQFRVTEDGESVHFTAGSDPAASEFRLEARRLANPDRLRIHWDDVAADIELVRRAPDEAKKFFPQPPGGAAYTYRQPLATDDGWETARASASGIDEAAVARMIQGIADSDPAQRRPSLIHSLLVARHGKLIVEEYFFGYGRDQVHDLRSAGKTFSSVLLGAAMNDGIDLSPDVRAFDIMGPRGPFANPDARKGRITLAQLMTHSAGLACDDNDDASPGNENTMQSQTSQPDWWKYTLDLPVVHDPGTHYAYCSANINLVGGVLTTATKTWLPELFRREVAEPLDFREWHWNLMPTDEGYLGGGAFLRPRDFLKIGQVYLDGGTWKGRRVVSAAWTKQSTAPRIKITPATTGLTPEQFGNFYSEGTDALAWHLNQIHAGERTYNAFAATGNGGQLLFVIPEFDMTVVITGGNYMQGGIWGRWGDQFIGGMIVPAIHEGEKK